MSAAAGAGAAAAVAAMIQATRAMGVIVKVEPAEFLGVLGRQQGLLVVHSSGGVFHTWHYYLTSYKGLAFYSVSREALELPKDIELIESKSIWVPG